MRRKEKEILDKEIIEKILKESDICRIAMVDGTEPYLVPMNYGYADGVIYMHSAPAGRKIGILSSNNRVCFEIEAFQEVIRKKEPCNWTSRYRSVIGYGVVDIITDIEDKKKALDILMHKYGYRGKSDYQENLLCWVAILKLTIESVTGKQSGDW